MTRSRGMLKPVLVRTGETLLSIGFVLVFFLVFMAILGASFPQGTGLRDLLQSPENGSELRDTRFALEFGHSAEQQTVEPGPEGFVAKLTNLTRKVKDKPSGAISWSGAKNGTDLRDRHAVQTFERSSATIAFDAKNQLRLSENSLVIVRRLEKQSNRRTRRASLVILGGELTGRLVDSAEGEMSVELITGGAISQILSSTDTRTDFRVETEEGEAATVDIYTGGADITAEGVTVHVPAAHSVTIRPGEAPSIPVPLPTTPATELPANGESRTYSKVRPEVRFGWNKTWDAEGWQIEIARDSEFYEIIHEGTLDSPELVHSNLPDGKSYWRVRASKGSTRSLFSEVRELSIVKDSDPPSLTVETAMDPKDATRVIVRGKTDPGAEVYVAKRAVTVDATGAFEIELELERGSNLIVIEAFDAVGNVSYKSEQIERRG